MTKDDLARLELLARDDCGDSTALKRFCQKMRIANNGCWIWTGASQRKGYGRFYFRGRADGAHRASYEIFNGLIPEGQEIDHICNNPSCVNPRHLRAVTGAENNLRSGSPTAKNARKTHCVRGHLLSGENIQVYRGWRRCLACGRVRSKERWQKRLAARMRND